MEPEASTITAAALVPPFRSCIGYFECISTGSSGTKNSEILLTKLHVQKERLMTWGQISGIPKTLKENHLWKLDVKKVDILSCLNKLLQLISRASELEEKYGLLQDLEVPSEDTATYLGSGRAKKLKKALAPGLEDHKDWIEVSADRKRWTIGDESKFEQLIVGVTGFINDLHDHIPLDSTKQQNEMVYKDLEALDIQNLRLVKSACEVTHQNWSDKANSLIEWPSWGFKETKPQSSSEAQLDNFKEPQKTQNATLTYLSLPKVNGKAHVHFVFTQPCFQAEIDLSCSSTEGGSNSFGSRVFHLDGDSFFPNELCEYSNKSKWSPGRRITDSMKLRYPCDIEKMITESNYKHSEARGALLEMKMPLARIYVYCGPCICALRTALTMCESMDSSIIKCLVRVDDRIDTHCCTKGKLNRLESLINQIKKMESTDTEELCDSFLLQTDLVDRVWLEKRIYALEEGDAKKSRVARGQELFRTLESQYDETHAFVFLGELATCQWMMQSSPFTKAAKSARGPRETEIYHYQLTSRYPNTWTRDYLGTFTPLDYQGKWKW